MPVNFKNRINTAMVSRIGFNTTHPVFFCKTRDKKNTPKVNASKKNLFSKYSI